MAYNTIRLKNNGLPYPLHKWHQKDTAANHSELACFYSWLCLRS